ncbi:MAG: alpha-ketoglutarate-dependent dioxygenase AlkB [Rhodospirillales bacterium]|nr:alpha-ketoglutarate-dependent dioxygenase AlkB [Rhodospirillales bacterium]
MMLGDPFEQPRREQIADGAILLRCFAENVLEALVAGVIGIAAVAPFRRMMTPGGFTMSVAITNCGGAGWVTDRRGYRYDPCDPETGLPWPAMPPAFGDLAVRAAAEAGFPGFQPDSCLINRYEPGARMSLHQDKNERDFTKPIVSVSLGLPAVFLFGGEKRSDRPLRIPLHHGDVVVWGGPARLNFHGVAPLADGSQPVTGNSRINLTFRDALRAPSRIA